MESLRQMQPVGGDGTWQGLLSQIDHVPGWLN